MLCQIHGKEMKQNAKGWYCSTPIEKTPDGKTVLAWCQWKPGDIPAEAPKQPQNQATNGMHACNALNNAIALTVAGKIGLDDLKDMTLKLYKILEEI